jgi:tetratricopeptide (TPR) repeat protein
VRFQKTAILILLAALILGTVGAGIFFKHYFVVCVFAVWFSVEFLFWRFPSALRSRISPKFRLYGFGALLDLYGKFDTVPDYLVEAKITELKASGTLSEYELRWLSRLRDLVELKGLVFGKSATGKKGLKQGFAYARRQVALPVDSPETREVSSEEVSLQDITESAILVADLYWKLYDTGAGEYGELSRTARRLFEEIFSTPFEAEASRKLIAGLTDSMQRDQGVPFLILNLIRNGEAARGRRITQFLLTSGVEMDQDIRSCLYWVSEIHWFTWETTPPLADYETTIRYLYHLCFTNPERAGFLEVDSQFFSQFEIVSELAREGFLFKETLIEKLLMLWRDHEGFFDKVFQSVLESMTQAKSKIYDERDNWELFWKREQEAFSRDYLYVVEGNLAFAGGQYEEAKTYYEKALKVNPNLRSALLNILFCYARLGLRDRQEAAAEELMAREELLPSVLYVIGDSFLIAGNQDKADAYYNELKRREGWSHRADYYRSTFCYENGLYEKALEFARRAHELNPSDSSLSYHLSLCYSAVGEKDQALDMVKKMGEAPQWLSYYRFTLERDAGRPGEASETLLQIPSDYFQDPEELEAAVTFARDRKDLVLLRHLKRKNETQTKN